MDAGRRRRLPRTLLFSEIAAILLTIALAFPTMDAVPPLLVGVPVLTYGWLGARIAERAPRNPVGWLLSAGAMAGAFGFLGGQYSSLHVIRDIDPLPAYKEIELVAAVVAPTLIGTSLMLTFLLFPTGKPPSPRWWSAAWLIAGTGLVAMTAILLSELDVIDEEAFQSFDTIFVTMVGVSSLLMVASLVVRSKRGTPQERAPIRGLLFTLLTMAVSFAIFVWQASDEDWNVSVIIAGITLTAGTLILIPLALTVSMIRYGLFDYEVGIRKRIASRVLAGLIVLAIAIVLLMFSWGVSDAGWRGQDAERATALTLGTGVLAGACLIVATRWARRFSDKVVFRDRATPYEVLSEFSDRVGEGYSLDDVLPRMAALLASGTGARSATVWLQTEGELRALASAPSDVTPPRLAREGDDLSCDDPLTHAFPVKHRGDFLGALSVTMPTNDPMNAAKEDLVKGLANQAGLVMRNVSLLEDVRESRRRIVQTQDDRARTLERNIHDGAQQQLVALAVKLRLADSLVEKDPQEARRMLSELQGEATDALENLRDLARGIYPPLLADGGLAAALEAQARKSPIPVELSHDSIGRYPQDVESSVYFCVLEALGNTAKYAMAKRITIRMGSSGGELSFEVSDDGVGFDPEAVRSGTGLQGMADRLDAIGGTLEVRSAPGSGTAVTGRVPVGGGA